MKLYDETILTWKKLLEPCRAKQLNPHAKGACWEDVGNQNMILRSDMAYELGGDNFPALSGIALTQDKTLVSEDEVLLFGPDLSQIKKEQPFARLTIVRVAEDGLGEGNALYNAIRKIEFTRYHLNPKGYMMRISAASERETVRISKDAIKEGIDFEKIGQLFVKAYHEHPKVEAVKIIFITLPDFPYNELEKQVSFSQKITAAIDHILKDVTMDCNACSLQEVCDEVEGMRQLHFAAKQNTH